VKFYLSDVYHLIGQTTPAHARKKKEKKGKRRRRRKEEEEEEG